MATIELDHATCIVSGMCASVAPDLFRVSDDSSEIVVLQPDVPAELVDDAINAELCCPVEAITVHD
ncbi:MAG: ferredoxin [bacterium]|nr:ferredoxin [bacterium]